MFKIEMIGNLGANAEIQSVDGNQFLTFQVYHSEYYVDKSTGQVLKEVIRASVSYNRVSENLARVLEKGQKVFVRGFGSFRIYTGNDHLQHVGINIRATELEICFDRVEKPKAKDVKPL